MCPTTQDKNISIADIIIFCSHIDLIADNELTDRLIISIANQKHCVHIHNIFFINSEALSSYVSKDGQLARYQIHDDIRLEVLKNDILLVKNVYVNNLIQDELNFDEFDELCPECFGTSPPHALSIDSFKLLSEWHTDVPLEAQILLGSFINQDSMTKNTDLKNFLCKKYERLYLVYDILLNSFNKNHFGIILQQITDYLQINYHSISSVFKITSRYGLTTSLEFAEKSLVTKTVQDKLYYQAFIKTYPITYDSVGGTTTKMVSLRDCHLILMLDNLVRLKYHRDPEPGEHRSKQLCMLPITIQGLPRDSLVTESWHDPEICDGSHKCPCKRSVSFSKEDAFDIILNLQPSEELCQEKFIQVCRWGNQSIFNVITDSTRSDPKISWLRTYLKDAITSQSLNRSASSLSIADDDAELTAQRVEIPNTEILAETDIPMLHELLNESLQELETVDAEQASVIYESNLETSMEQLTLSSTMNQKQEDRNILKTFGLNKFSPPPMIEKHPQPASGRDDDINKLREILDDVLVKTCLDPKICFDSVSLDRIIFGPDNKIGINLLKLIKENDKYEKFLPEFPLLHLRKSKVNTLFSAYRDCGLIELLMVMRDENTNEWSKLITAEHIDTATRHVRRIAQAIQLAMSLKFVQHLPPQDADSFLNDMLHSNPLEVSDNWNNAYQNYLDSMCSTNATFSLHYDIMVHCNEVVAVKLAERLGGEDGYHLLLGTVKSSLSFSFLNNASSYAPYCTRLLAAHYSAGTFHQKQKKCLFSTPIGNSTVNFSCDTKREMDHKDALKGFRAGCSQESATRRMSLIDSFNSSAVQKMKSSQSKDDSLSWTFTETDINHIIRVTEVILRQDGLSAMPSDTPSNVYASKMKILSCEVLDKKTKDVGIYLIQRFMSKDMLLGLTEADCPNLDDLKVSSDLKNRLKKKIGVTLKRSVMSKVSHGKSDREEKESKRSKFVSQIMKQTNHLSSDMNMCQSIVKPDCSKPKLQKASSVKQALTNVLNSCDPDNLVSYITSYEQVMPQFLNKAKIVAVEFAGVKFKTRAFTGNQYIKYVQNAILNPLLQQLPNLQRIILCEEKYSFTPDEFKAGTRQHRRKDTRKSISVVHLKTKDDMLSADTFEKDAIRGTEMGKSLISNYLAANAQELQLSRAVTLDIDSELKVSCGCNGACNCYKYAIPIRCEFSKQFATPEVCEINIQQRKGEAEMAQLDWLCESAASLDPEEDIISFVTSGDIDAVVIHLFAVSSRWPRCDNGKLKNTVYVILQKPNKKFDVYNITAILHTLENYFDSVFIGMKVAIGLCMGGNDFIPKFKGMTHDKVLKTFLFNDHFRSSLVTLSPPTIHASIYEEFVKHLFCPSSLDPESASADEVRASTRKRKRKCQSGVLTGGMELSSADSWMPPSSVLHRLSNLIQLQIEYILSAGDHTASLPDFMSLPCLKQTTSGQIEYDFGPEAFMPVDELLFLSEIGKRSHPETPQKGKRKKRQMTSTPKKLNN